PMKYIDPTGHTTTTVQEVIRLSQIGYAIPDPFTTGAAMLGTVVIVIETVSDGAVFHGIGDMIDRVSSFTRNLFTRDTPEVEPEVMIPPADLNLEPEVMI